MKIAAETNRKSHKSGCDHGLLSQCSYGYFKKENKAMCRMSKVGKDHCCFVEYFNDNHGIKRYMLICFLYRVVMLICKALQYEINTELFDLTFAIKDPDQKHNLNRTFFLFHLST